jgi:S-adenosylmethionine:tRNA ribosyltransferase-isomerase
VKILGTANVSNPSRVADYDFVLPEDLIAQVPPVERSGAQMLVLDREFGTFSDQQFVDLPQLLNAGDLLVLNNSRVLPARLFGRRAVAATQPSHAPGRVEVLLTEEKEAGVWSALVRPGRRLHVGQKLLFPAQGAAILEAEILEHGEFGERTLRFEPVHGLYPALEQLGQMPLPPYIHREHSISTEADRERYQTVYAQQPGSVAAPTAGLHFTEAVLAAIRARGVEIAYVTLHVGLGTFQPVRVERLDDIHLHTERYTLSQETADAVNRARADGRRIVAAGTTTVRTLEHCAGLAGGAPLAAHSGTTDIFISPGYSFQFVGALLTNFHLPQSTLLMLVSAFGGYGPVSTAYRHAVAARYRFFSYGDCMFLH